MLQTHIRLALLLTMAVGSTSLSLAQDEVKAPTRSAQYTKKEFTGSDGAKLAYWIMTPKKIDPSKKYPLVLALHGRGGNTSAAAALANDDLRAKYPCFVLAPAVSRKEVWAVPGDFGKLRGTQRIKLALEALESVKKAHPIDPQRVYVTGQSMGGFGSFGAVANSAQTFAAAMPICGGWSPDDAGKMKSVAIWVFHGDADKTVPVERSQKMVDALKEAGANVKYTEYPGVGHNSWTKTYENAEVWDWLFKQRRSE